MPVSPCLPPTGSAEGGGRGSTVRTGPALGRLHWLLELRFAGHKERNDTKGPQAGTPSEAPGGADHRCLGGLDQESRTFPHTPRVKSPRGCQTRSDPCPFTHSVTSLTLSCLRRCPFSCV